MEPTAPSQNTPQNPPREDALSAGSNSPSTNVSETAIPLDATQSSSVTPELAQSQSTELPAASTSTETSPEQSPQQPTHHLKFRNIFISNSGLLRFFRVILWTATIVLVSLGTGLRSASASSLSFTYGSTMKLEHVGTVFLIIGGVIGGINFIWGATRWFWRWHFEKWGVGRVVGKLIGGGIWRLIIIAPVVLALLAFVAPTLARKVTNDIATKDVELATNSVAKLGADFSANKLTPDEYVNYLLLSISNPSELPQIYQSDNLSFVSDVVREIDKQADNLSVDTLQKIAEFLSFDSITIDTDVSGNISKNTFFTENTYATTTSVTTLNKAKLSSDGNFIVYYTDKGEDKISDKDAEKIGEMMENLVDRYESVLGLKYHVEFEIFGSENYGPAKNVLNYSGIDTEYINKAMPIYVANPYEGENNTLASYAGLKFKQLSNKTLLILGRLLGEETSKLYLTTPALPFINIIPDNISNASLELVLAHEFGHHFAMNYCRDTFDKECSSEENFVDETVPQLMALLTVEKQPKEGFMVDWHSGNYLGSTNLAINDEYHYGYGSMAFLYQYYKIVPDGLTKILNALMEDDAYNYLVKQAGEEKMREVLHSLAINNLISDYGEIYSLYATRLPRGESLPCYDICTKQYDNEANSWPESSIHYFYFPMARFSNGNISVQLNDSRLKYDFIVMGKKGSQWEELPLLNILKTTDKVSPVVEINMQDYVGKYSTIALVVSNYRDNTMTVAEAYPDRPVVTEVGGAAVEAPITTKLGFSLNIEGGDGGWKASGDTILKGASSKNGLLGRLYNNTESTDMATGGNTIAGDDCIDFYVDDIFDIAGQFVGIFGGIDESIDQAIVDLNKEIQNAKSQTGHRKATICTLQLNSDIDFDDLKSRLGGWTVLDNIDSVARTSVLLDYDLLYSTFNAKILMKDDSLTGLYTVTLE